MSQADTTTDDRAIRVFISSTFRDMQLERDELVKRVFPRIRRLCEERQVSWSEIDLRWGVTDEQKAEGAVLPICLAEIDRTRPYFIGLIGQRYGWVPDEIPADLADQLGWLTDDAGRSVTEMEILHGVLNHPDADGHAFFYLRDPAWVDTLPPDERTTYVEETETGVRRLAELRDRIRATGHPTADYPDPVALGERVLADLTALVERRYPADAIPDARARADSVHAAFGRARFGMFVERPDLAAALDRHADGDGPPLLVTGPSGIGASALVTAWARDRATTHAGEHLIDEQVIVHHVEADADAADHRSMAARLIAALDPRPDDDANALATADPAAIRSALGAAMRRATRRTVVVIDGADRLDDVDGAPDLRWLPREVPPGVRLIVTGGTRPRTAFEHRGWPVLDLPPLTDAERRAIAGAVLATGAKALDADNLDVLVAPGMTGNARFLRTIVDELRQHGDHFTLRPLIDHLVAATTVDDLIELVLARYETDFDRDRPGLTRDVFTALWAARRGLAESELLALLAAPGDDHLPQATWAPLHLAAEAGIVSRGGLLGFAHGDLRRAVEDRYLPTDDDRRAAHARLATFFAARPRSPRVADELGWQQADAGDHDGLHRTLADLDLLELAYTRNPADVRRLWTRLAGTGPELAATMHATYAAVLADPAAHDRPHGSARPRQLVGAITRLLTDAGAPDAALPLHRHLLAAARLAPAGSIEGPDGDARLRSALVNLGAAEWMAGDLARADATLGEAVERCRAAGDVAMLTAALGNLAMTRRDLGRHEDAAGLFTEEEQHCRDLDDEHGLQASLGNHAHLLRDLGRHDEAMALLREQEQVCRHLADATAIGRALAGQATVLADRGDLASATELTERYVALMREEGEVRGLTEGLVNLAINRVQLGDIAAAMRAGEEAETLARQFGDPALIARVLVARASTSAAVGDWPGVERIAREAELTARGDSHHRLVAEALGLVGTARREQGDLAGSRAAHDDELAAAIAAGDDAAIAGAHSNLGNTAIATQRADEALHWYGLAEPVLRRLDLPASLLPLLANRGQVHHATGNVAAALADFADATAAAAQMGDHAGTRRWGEAAVTLAYQVGDAARAETLWTLLAAASRATGDEAMLQKALGEHALLLIGRVQQAGAVPDRRLLGAAAAMLDEQEVVCRRSGDVAGLTACVGNRAIVLRYQGDLGGSLACLDEQLALATRSGDAQGALFATANRGEVLGLLGRTAEARETLMHARATAASYGLTPMVDQLDAMIAAL